MLPIIMFSFSQCSSQKKLQQKSPVQLKEVYCQSWVAGVKGGGSGMNIFIPVETITDKDIELDHVFFRGKASKLTTKPQNKTLYIGRFKNTANSKQDIVMSSDAKQEYGNKMPEATEEIPFELKDDECVVSYKVGSKTKYFKIENVVEKQSIPYPSAPNNTPKIKQ
jgi:hypothetical protein